MVGWMQIDPMKAKGWLRLSSCLAQLKEWKAASRAMRECIRLTLVDGIKADIEVRSSWFNHSVCKHVLHKSLYVTVPTHSPIRRLVYMYVHDGLLTSQI